MWERNGILILLEDDGKRLWHSGRCSLLQPEAFGFRVILPIKRKMSEDIRTSIIKDNKDLLRS